MQKYIAVISFLLLAFLTKAQEQLPNMDFEDWEKVKIGVDDPPNEFQNEFEIKVDSLKGGVWGSGNILLDTLDDIYNRPFMKDTTYSYSGNKAVLLRTQMIGPLPATGTLWTGSIGRTFDFQKKLFGAKTGVPFSSTPSNFKGFYDYLSVQGDTCLIACYLTKWNGVREKRDTVGFGSFTTDQTTEGFKAFDVPIFYKNISPSVDSVIIIMLSSYGGIHLRGKEGSTLIVDSTFFDYGAIALDVEENEDPFDVDVYAKNGNIKIDAHSEVRNAKVEVFDITGKMIYSKKYSVLKSEIIDINREQILIVKIDNGKNKLNKKIFVKP